jgi:hypothetical protein
MGNNGVDDLWLKSAQLEVGVVIQGEMLTNLGLRSGPPMVYLSTVKDFAAFKTEMSIMMGDSTYLPAVYCHDFPYVHADLETVANAFAAKRAAHGSPKVGNLYQQRTWPVLNMI